MAAKRKSFKVRSGNSHITVSPWTHPGTGKERWRFAYRPAPGAPWKYRTFTTKADAERSATDKLEALATGTNTLAELPPARRRWLESIHRSVGTHDQTRVSDFIQSMHQSGEISAAITRFISGQISKAGEKTPHLATISKILEAVGKHFSGKSVTDIHLPELQAWFNHRTQALGWKRKSDIRANLVQFWRWARKQRLIGPEPDTVPDRLQEFGSEIKGSLRILTAAEFKQLEEHILPEFRAWLVLGCFAGLRPGEIHPGPVKKSAKRGLRCEEIDWQFSVIRLPAVVSKGGKRSRNIPISPALREYLQWAGIKPGMTGPVCMENPSHTRELARLGKLLFNGAWPQNSCRHSFGSYRNAILRNLPQVAEEMGSSPAMLHAHYHNPQPEQLGKSWFELRPGVPICSDETGISSQFIATA